MRENGPMRATLLVAVGGIVGASARWGTGRVFSGHGGDVPWATLVVNLVGCLAIGFAARRFARGSDGWLVIVTGVLGGLTTFSTFANDTRSLVADGRGGVALAYVAASVVGGLAATEIARNGRIDRTPG